MDIANILVFPALASRETTTTSPQFETTLPTFARQRVIAATPINSVPLSNSGSARNLTDRPDDRPTGGQNGQYMEVDEQASTRSACT